MNVTCTSYVIPSDYRGIKVFLRQVERIAFALGIARSEKALATTSSRRRLELRLRSNSHANDFSRKRLRAPPQFQPKEQTQNSRSKEMGCAVSSMKARRLLRLARLLHLYPESDFSSFLPRLYEHCIASRFSNRVCPFPLACSCIEALSWFEIVCR